MHEHPHFFYPRSYRKKASLERGRSLIWLLHSVCLRSDAVNSQNGVEGQGAELAENKGWRATQLSFFKIFLYFFVCFFLAREEGKGREI